jgi:hypothetical protein
VFFGKRRHDGVFAVVEKNGKRVVSPIAKGLAAPNDRPEPKIVIEGMPHTRRVTSGNLW